METGEVRRIGVAGRLRLRRGPATKEARLREFAETAREVALNRQLANAFFEQLADQPVEAWGAMLCEKGDVWTPQMVMRLADAAEEMEEDSPERALSILDAAERLVALVPPSSFAYDYACLKLGARRAASLADLGRFAEALSALRNARRFVSLGLSNEHERAELLVERAYVYLRMGRFRHVLRSLRLTARLFESACLEDEHDRTLRVLWHAMSLIPEEEVLDVM